MLNVEPRTKEENRRYYLHRCVKNFCRVKAQEKTIFITGKKLVSLTKKKKGYVNELRLAHGYTIQSEIPAVNANPKLTGLIKITCSAGKFEFYVDCSNDEIAKAANYLRAVLGGRNAVVETWDIND